MKFNELPRGVFRIITLAPQVLMQSVDNQKVLKVNSKVPADQVIIGGCFNFKHCSDFTILVQAIISVVNFSFRLF